MTVLTPTPTSQETQRSKLLSPAAYNESMLPALRLARSSRIARRVAQILFFALVAATILAAVAPWQQSVRGTGNVIAYSPFERQQVIEAPIKGRITRLGDDIFENAHVKKGQLIAEIADIDSNYLGRLEEQLAASERQVDAAQLLLSANQRNLEAAKTIVTSFQAQVEAYTAVKEQVIVGANAAVEAARHKVEAEKQQLAEHQAALEQVRADYERQETLYKEQIKSQVTFQTAERYFREAEAKVAKAEAYVKAAEQELAEKQSARQASEQKAQVDIDYATAAVRKANADVAKAESDVAKAEADVNKAKKELLDAETKFARQQNQLITAPFDGFLTSITPNQSSRILKQGDPICTIVPDTSDRAVQLWLDGNDAPLVEPGRHVRLQFEGWPALQFAGWPSVAVGTFGGEIVSVDATDDGKGRFRVLVLPDTTDKPWPDERFLRQGVRANGWVILERVPLWYEVWRSMNGFPPVVATSEPEDKGAKKPKLPKP